jgi:hypothetical protein
MKNCLFLWGVLFLTLSPLCAQQAVENDSIRLLPLSEIAKLMEQQSAPINSGWLEFDNTLPKSLIESKEHPRLSLHPYTANTPCNWDPIFHKKIAITPQTWRTRQEVPQTLAFGHAFRAGGQAGPAVAPSEIDLMLLFTRDFWRFHWKKNRARTLEVLKGY